MKDADDGQQTADNRACYVVCGLSSVVGNGRFSKTPHRTRHQHRARRRAMARLDALFWRSAISGDICVSRREHDLRRADFGFHHFEHYSHDCVERDFPRNEQVIYKNARHTKIASMSSAITTSTNEDNAQPTKYALPARAASPKFLRSQ